MVAKARKRRETFRAEDSPLEVEAKKGLLFDRFKDAHTI
jgi:hypothetical protein